MKKKELVDKLVSEIELGKVKTLGIYGHGASGKSTFAQELFQALDSEKVNLLETDPYITSERHLVVPKQAPNQKVTACLPVAHELASLERDIIALKAGMDILTIDEPWKPSEVLSGSKPFLIVEGMSVGFLPKELFDKTICFYTDAETELERRLARDTIMRNRDASFILASHQMRREQYLQYYRETESKADILVDQSADKFKVKMARIISYYIEEKIKF
ncbi:uridine kinase family protein [Streptococcus pseudopneumoniae]|uniref:uridine kinase family protein n=1 Tax=Streptococcus pseudopneumoniae TaxID=257758 RepID=UPI00066B8E03|nr:phosphoribulokinase [Streptococcus pseudopneumoniae]